MDLTAADYAWAAAIARSTCNRFRFSHLADDATGEAYLALWLCSEQYDPSRGPTLHQYSFRRVRGAVIDVLRALGEIDRCWDLHGSRSFVPLNSGALADTRLMSDAIESRADVDRLMKPLCRRWQYATRRRCIDDADVSTVAREMGISDGRVSQIVVSSMRRMRTAVRRSR